MQFTDWTVQARTAYSPASLL